MQGIIPLLGGVIMAVTFAYGLQQFLKPDWLQTDSDTPENITIFGAGAVGVVGILAMVLGAIAMAVQWVTSPGYFKGETLAKRSASRRQPR